MLACLTTSVNTCKQLTADPRIRQVLLVFVQAMDPSYSRLPGLHFLFERLSCLWFCLFYGFALLLPGGFGSLFFTFTNKISFFPPAMVLESSKSYFYCLSILRFLITVFKLTFSLEIDI